MQYLLHGQIFEVIPKQYTDKKSGEVTKEFTEVTVEQVVLDENGFKVKSVETIQFPQDEFTTLKQAIDKYIVIPYEFRTWRDASTKQMQSAMMMSAGRTYVIYQTNPFSQKPPKA